MNIDILNYAIIFLVMIIGVKMLTESEYFQLRCIYADKDGKKYCVRERNKLEEAANKLATVRERLDIIVNSCATNKANLTMTKLLIKNYNPKKICETLPTSEYTAYSENKGEKLAFCLDTNKNGEGNLIDINTLMFVAIHELAHVGTKSIGHTPEFWRNMKILLEVAAEENVYEPKDYSKTPVQYCGMKITDNPYFD